ncbi:gamma-glutamylcyclotransferase family protein [Membranihabitans marinus]|uniref:gamma-glutamylcyclotransferase family protein n=1 Tax=Membranihabitans marinus TaxID=1227546 RepID=UPI001F4262CD|nr:gamma-glutamylcyclotransferase family protein [Membranihabitans marinus]
MSQYLFSYGTLQIDKVQIETFGRLLQGSPEILPGYRLESLKITDDKVLKRSDQEYHPIAKATGQAEDQVKGMLFEISDEELAQADEYEVEDYQRIEVEFVSGRKGWIYVEKL